VDERAGSEGEGGVGVGGLEVGCEMLGKKERVSGMEGGRGERGVGVSRRKRERNEHVAWRPEGVEIQTKTDSCDEGTWRVWWRSRTVFRERFTSDWGRKERWKKGGGEGESERTNVSATVSRFNGRERGKRR